MVQKIVFLGIDRVRGGTLYAIDHSALQSLS